jgi:hypothetical protein
MPYAGKVVPLDLAFPQRQTSYFNLGGISPPFLFTILALARSENWPGLFHFGTPARRATATRGSLDDLP